MTKELVMEKTEKENPEEEKKIQDFFLISDYQST